MGGVNVANEVLMVIKGRGSGKVIGQWNRRIGNLQ